MRALEAMTPAEFSECLYSYIGNRFYDRDQSYLIFYRYDADGDGRINYRDWSRLVMPCDQVLSGMLLGRVPSTNRLCEDTAEVFKRLLRAHLNLEQAHEYLRQRMDRSRNTNQWSLEEIFEALDGENKCSITVYDLEKMIMQMKKSGSRSLLDDIELLINLYDRTGYRKINF